MRPRIVCISERQAHANGAAAIARVEKHKCVVRGCVGHVETPESCRQVPPASLEVQALLRPPGQRRSGVEKKCFQKNADRARRKEWKGRFGRLSGHPASGKAGWQICVLFEREQARRKKRKAVLSLRPPGERQDKQANISFQNNMHLNMTCCSFLMDFRNPLVTTGSTKFEFKRLRKSRGNPRARCGHVAVARATSSWPPGMRLSKLREDDRG